MRVYPSAFYLNRRGVNTGIIVGWTSTDGTKVVDAVTDNDSDTVSDSVSHNHCCPRLLLQNTAVPVSTHSFENYSQCEMPCLATASPNAL